MKRLLSILLLCGAAAAQAQQEEALCAPLAAPPGQVGIRVDALPGSYTLLTATNLNAPWTPETNFTIGAEGSTDTAFPFLGRPVLFIRAAGSATSTGATHVARFWTQGRSFSPVLSLADETLETLLWTWSDGTTSSDHPEATRDFGSAANRLQRLSVEPPAALTAINLGFDASDGGETTPLPFRDPQNVSAVEFPHPLPGLRYFAASYNPLTNTLDFSGFTALEAVECFQASTLRHVVLTNLPNLKRVCLEGADLQELDLSGNPALEDVRGALNAFTEIRVDRGTGSNLWHWCTRDNPQLVQSFQDAMTNFFALRELYIWNNNQSGHFAPVSTYLVDLQAADNRYASADLSGKEHLVNCSLSGNRLTNLVLTGCAALRMIDVHGNRLGTAQLDALLEFLDRSAPDVYSAQLDQNAALPSENGYADYVNLINRGVSVYVDWPHMFDGRTNAPGGSDALTFVTTGAHLRVEIQTDHGTPTNILWHWGDGRINRDVTSVDQYFSADGIFTNYVEVQPPGCVSRFGAEEGAENQGIRAVYNASNFPALSFLYLSQQGLEELSLAGCANLTQLHLAGNPVSAATCDQWFIDLDAAVTGPVADAEFFYPAAAPSAASAAARSNLAAKGYALQPL
ncbi:MAG: leucine-rich repeat domain-containing protein [Opitutae bacterium]|nr:leucine-rich repeat domain-containing protein [Opitutae bacterium]